MPLHADGNTIGVLLAGHGQFDVVHWKCSPRPQALAADVATAPDPPTPE
jgi:hypothetical protein